jgi:ubiquinone biosynthesis protein
MYDSSEPVYDTFRGRVGAGLRRGSHVASVLGRFGLSYLVHQLDPRQPRRVTPVDESVAKLDMPVRLRLMLEELGATAIKLGQVLSTRADLVPAPYIKELRKLQDDVPASSPEDVNKIITEELGRPVAELFAEFEETPRASASIAQVHFARLADGSPVAVKVQHRGVAGSVETDLEIILRMAQLAERSIPWAAENGLLQLAQEFAHGLRQELNFLIEARNTDRLRENLEDDKQAGVPQVYWDLCTRRVLVVEWVEGAKANAPEELAQQGVDRPAAARSFGALMIRQILRDGYFHNDPHPGNVLFPGGDRVIFLDCGNAVALDRNTRDTLLALLLATLSDEPQEVTDHLLALGVAQDRTDLQQLTADVGRMISYYSGFASSSEVGLGYLLDELLTLVLRHGVRMQPALAAIAKSLMVTEGVCLELDPQFDAQALARDEVQRLMWQRLAPQRLGADVVRVVRSTYRYAMLLPRQVNQVLQKLQGGGVRIRIFHENIDRPLHRLDLMVNRIAFAIVVASIIVSSTTLVTSERLTGSLGHWLTYTYLFVGIVLGGWLLFSILRSGRL